MRHSALASRSLATSQMQTQKEHDAMEAFGIFDVCEELPKDAKIITTSHLARFTVQREVLIVRTHQMLNTLFPARCVFSLSFVFLNVDWEHTHTSRRARSTR